MKEESQVDLMKVAMQLTVALMEDQQGRAKDFLFTQKLDRRASPLDLFDEIYAHLVKTLTAQGLIDH